MKRFIFLIFVFGCFIRFIYFPDNIYFGYDQARDAFESQNIYKNIDFKIIGPSAAAENLFHGPLYWYLIGPLYLLGNGDPKFPAAFLLIINAVGIFIIFWIGKLLFNPRVGILSAIIYAFSFEQTQYALYFGNPGPAVLTIMMFYGGLVLLTFKKNWRGLSISLAGLGLSIQLEFFLVYLIVVFIFWLALFKNTVVKVLNLKRIITSGIILFLTIFPFILAELKFDFRTIKTLLGLFPKISVSEKTQNYGLYLEKLSQHMRDNISSLIDSHFMLVVFTILIFYALLKYKKDSREILFLVTWILSSSTLLVFGSSELYYTNIGVSLAFILLTAYLVSKISKKLFFLASIIVFTIAFSNVKLITNQNKNGIINKIYVQEGMLLSREKAVVDYIYKEADGKPIVVSALTMPLKVNTTWSYLFKWYGEGKYGYLPFWSGEAALGFPGGLPSWKSQREDYIMFSIIESTRGVRSAFVENFLEEQEQYGQILEEKVFGEKSYAQLKVQKRGNLNE